MIYDLDFFEAWNEMDKLYEDEGGLDSFGVANANNENNSETTEIAEIKAGIEKALDLYRENSGIPYEKILIPGYKNALSGNLSNRDIGFWYVVRLILANIPAFGDLGAGNTFLDQYDNNVDLGVVYMCNAYIAEQALYNYLEANGYKCTWNNPTLHVGAGEEEPDFINVCSPRNLKSISIDVKNIDNWVDCASDNALLKKASSVNWHHANGLYFVNEQTKYVYFIYRKTVYRAKPGSTIVPNELDCNFLSRTQTSRKYITNKLAEKITLCEDLCQRYLSDPNYSSICTTIMQGHIKSNDKAYSNEKKVKHIGYSTQEASLANYKDKTVPEDAKDTLSFIWENKILAQLAFLKDKALEIPQDVLADLRDCEIGTLITDIESNKNYEDSDWATGKLDNFIEISQALVKAMIEGKTNVEIKSTITKFKPVLKKFYGWACELLKNESQSNPQIN